MIASATHSVVLKTNSVLKTLRQANSAAIIGVSRVMIRVGSIYERPGNLMPYPARCSIPIVERALLHLTVDKYGAVRIRFKVDQPGSMYAPGS